MTPEFHPLAQAELNDAAGFYEAAAVGLGGDFLNEMGASSRWCAFSRTSAASIPPQFVRSRRVGFRTRWSIRGSANGLSFSPLRISVASRDTGRGELAEGRHNKTLQLNVSRYADTCSARTVSADTRSLAWRSAHRVSPTSPHSHSR